MPAKLKQLFLLFGCAACIFASSHTLQAAELSYDTDYDFSYFSETSPVFNNFYPEYYSLDKNGNTRLNFGNLYDPKEDGVSFHYEIEMSKNDQFNTSTAFKTTETSLTLSKKQFGTNGGKFYFRIRACAVPLGGTPVYSQWSEPKELIYVKINKTNFPGMYSLLKNGGKAHYTDGLKNQVYDKNKDGWLDPKELQDLISLCTATISTQKNGKYTSEPSSKVSSLTGIEYLPEVKQISLAQYSGKKIDLSQNQVEWLYVSGITSKEITVIAPDAKNVFIEAAYSTKLTKMDISKCTKAVDMSAYGANKTKTLKLPKANKNLKVLSISDCDAKTLNVNSYTSLQQLYIYRCNTSKVTLDKCKNLKYLYLYCCDKIKSLDTTKNTKLRGIDLYASKGLTKSKVKVAKKTKLTWGKGKWWYSTDAYKKDMQNLYQ